MNLMPLAQGRESNNAPSLGLLVEVGESESAFDSLVFIFRLRKFTNTNNYQLLVVTSFEVYTAKYK